VGHHLAMTDLAASEMRIDELTVPLLVPLRTSKTLDGAVMADLLAAGRDLVHALGGVEIVPKSLVGKAWFIFTAMLAEADHAREPEPILDAAWHWAELLRKAFGPEF
jgi:hypothetical protein